MSSDDAPYSIATPKSQNEGEQIGWIHGPASRRTSASSLPSIPRPPWLSRDTWPFDTSALNVEGRRIAVTDVGRGPVLIFVHTGFWSFIWRDVIIQLRDEFRCICFDAPGAGLSEPLPLTEVGLERAARALTAILEILNLEHVTLVLHDLGGPSGIAGAARVSNRIRALCIVNAFAWRPSGAVFRGMLALMGNPVVREFDVITGVLPVITASSFGIGRHMDKTARKTFLAGIRTQGIRTFHAYMRDSLRSETVYGRTEWALAGPFSQLLVCTIFGERNDPMHFQRHWGQLFPHAHHVVVPKGNHFPMCDDPDLVAESIRRLNDRM
jgi:pimeloyl-ACP methyl ester carboxylesterase